MPLGTDSTRLPPTHHHRLRPGVTCTPPPGPLPLDSSLSTSSGAVRRHVHDQHRDVVVLLVPSEHPFNQVLQKPSRTGQQLRIGPCGHGRQFLETSVQTTIPVLYQTVRIKDRSATGAQAERVLLPRAGPAERRASFHSVEPRRATCF